MAMLTVRRATWGFLAGFLAWGALCAADPGFTARADGGPVHNVVNLILDGRLPEEGADWDGEQSVYWDKIGVSLIIDLRKMYTVRDVRLQVDNNDDYDVDYSTDGIQYRNLFHIKAELGNVDWGMDTFSTVEGEDQYDKALDFPAVTARFVRVRAVGGDDMYAVSEVEVLGDPVKAPAAGK